MTKNVSIRDFDWVLLAVILAICALGVVQIYSTTLHTKFAGAHWKQLLWILFGLGLLFGFSIYDYHDLLNHAPVLYFSSLALLVGVLVFGNSVYGARRWFHLGGFSFQVSEPVKVVIILLLARFFSDTPGDRVSRNDVAKVFFAVAFPAARSEERRVGKECRL